MGWDCFAQSTYSAGRLVAWSEGRHSADVCPLLRSSDEPSELPRWLRNDDNTINIVPTTSIRTIISSHSRVRDRYTGAILKENIGVGAKSRSRRHRVANAKNAKIEGWKMWKWYPPPQPTWKSWDRRELPHRCQKHILAYYEGHRTPLV